MPIYRDPEKANKASDKKVTIDPPIVPEFICEGPVFATEDEALMHAIKEGIGSLETAATCCRLVHKTADAARFEQMIKEIQDAAARRKWDL